MTGGAGPAGVHRRRRCGWDRIRWKTLSARVVGPGTDQGQSDQPLSSKSAGDYLPGGKEIIGYKTTLGGNF